MLIKNILYWIWQLPQNLLGVLWRNIKKDSIITDISNNDIKSVGAKAFLVKNAGAITLGKYVFISQTYRDQSITIKHECGHVKQSKMLGPLYLIVIGIPSIIWAATHRAIAPNKPYDWFYTEAWANKLGGVD